MTTESSCPENHDLERLLRGLLSEHEAADLERHVESCASCLERMRLLQGDDGFLDDLRSSTRPLPWQPDLNTGLLARVCRLAAMPDDEAATTPQSGLTPEKHLQETPDSGPVGAYQLLRPLGHGGMGVVYLARHTGLKRTVALKRIRVDSRAHPERLARFRREAELLARLRHGNVVQIYEAGEHEGSPFLAMEYVEGGTLAQKLSTGPLPVRTVAELVEALARGMHAAHECGVIHRDLKPANVMLAADGTPKIMDFGLAKTLAAEGAEPSAAWVLETQSGAILGTPSYIAPEQIAASPEVGPAADVYALGAILYECLTGRPPFKAATALETLEQVRSQEPVPPHRLQPGVPRDLDTICLECLRKEPRRRYASALALADDLRRFLDGKPVRARPTPIWERLWKWARRRPALATLIVVTGLALTGLIGGAVVYEQRLRTALAQAEGNRERADANYQRARETVQRMLGRLEGGRLRRLPELRELWEEQLEDALAFYQGILHELDNPSPAVRRDVAEAYEATAAIQAKLGRLKAAAENYGQALELLQRLADEQPDDPASRGRLAACSNALGRVYLGAGRLEEAAACQQQSLALADELAHLLPAISRQEELGQYHHDLANVYRQQKRWEQAEIQYREAVALRERLQQQRPSDRHAQAALAESYAHLTTVYQQMRREDQTRDTFRKAESVLGPLVRDFPEELDLALELAQLYVSMVPGGPDNPEGAERGLAAYALIVQAADAALRQEPHLLVARQALVAACRGRGLLLHRLRRYPEALRDWDRGVELADEPERSSVRCMRAASRAATGDHRRAAAEAGALAAGEQLPRGDLYNLACVYAVCLGQALRDANLSPPERRQREEDYAGRALAILRRVHAAGDLTPSGWYKVDPDLDPLRERADFRKFLQEVEPEK